ncbi:MAG: DUF2071 domain-containing protein [Armatimonadetes bacterium]|nr:DUF2071 domain-containing protein [Armatimonadota bacterium]
MPKSQLDDLLALRERPSGSPLMRQTWRHLSFLHWEVDPAAIQPTLPDGLEVDTFEDRAYVSFIPFEISDVRFVGRPWMPRFRFAEWNLRTYVRHRGTNPGIWFYSLEASDRMAVLGARASYRLPYHFGKVALTPDSGICEYSCLRKWPGPQAAASSATFEWSGEPKEANPGSLEFWLVERYLLYSRRRDQLFCGRVSHAPYQVVAARVQHLDYDIARAEGLQLPAQPLAGAQFCMGVDVDVFPLTSCD